MKRGTYLILIALAVGLIVAGAVLAVRDRVADVIHTTEPDVTDTNVTETDGAETYADSGDFDAAGTTSILVELGAADLHIYPAVSGMISVETDGDAQISVYRENGVLTIREKENGGVSLFSSDDSQAVIWLPAGFAGELHATLASGEVNVNRLDLPGLDMDISTASGEVRLYSCSLNGLTLSSASGDLWIGEDALSGPLSVFSVSGEFSAYEVSAADVRVSSVSGEVWLSIVSAASVSAETTSGDVWLDDITAGSVTVSTASGEVNLSMPGSAAEYDLRCSTASGQVTGGKNAVGGEIKLSVSTLSGDVNVTFEEDE